MILNIEQGWSDRQTTFLFTRKKARADLIHPAPSKIRLQISFRFCFSLASTGYFDAEAFEFFD